MLLVIHARFRDLGLHDNRVVVLVSDHGILLGDRGWTGKIAQELRARLVEQIGGLPQYDEGEQLPGCAVRSDACAHSAPVRALGMSAPASR